ncbi:23064_t:CDS:2, partial [Gigaspora margarita]
TYLPDNVPLDRDTYLPNNVLLNQNANFSNNLLLNQDTNLPDNPLLDQDTNFNNLLSDKENEHEKQLEDKNMPIQLSSSTDSTAIIPIHQVMLNHLSLTRNHRSYNYILRGPRVLYTRLSGLSKKVINLAIKNNMCDELDTLLQDFITDAKSKIELVNSETSTNMEINNLIVTRHKGRQAKRFKSC